MRKIYVLFVFLLSFLLIGSKFQTEVKADEESYDIEITIENRLPTSFILGSRAPDFKNYFYVKVNGESERVLNENLDLGGFDINTVGTYIIEITITRGDNTVKKQLEVSVVTEDVTPPTIVITKPFVTNEDGLIGWDTQDSMELFMNNFLIVDDVDGWMMSNESMFEGIENVNLNSFGQEYTINVVAIDRAGNKNEFGEYTFVIVDTRGNISIDINQNPPVEFVVGSDAPNFLDYFILKDNSITKEKNESMLSGVDNFNINQVGTYTIYFEYSREFVFDEARDMKSASIEISVISEDVTGPTITLTKEFAENSDGLLGWDAKDSIEVFMSRFIIKDNVDGIIEPHISMFRGLEKVKLENYQVIYTVNIVVQDKAGNFNDPLSYNFVIVDTTGSVLIEVNEDLPVEFVVGTSAPNFLDYFTLTDNGVEIPTTQDMLGLNLFDINQVGTYTVTLLYSREFVFDRSRDLKNERVRLTVIEEDITPPEITTYKVDDDINLEGQLPWSYQSSLDILIDRFSVKDNVDGIIKVTRDMFEGIDDVDINTIDTEYVVTFRVLDNAGNESVKIIRLFVVDDVSPYVVDVQNLYFTSRQNLDMLSIANDITMADNYDDSEKILKLVINSDEIFEKVKMSYLDLEKYKNMYTEEQIAAAAQSYNYVLKDGEYQVPIVAFYNSSPNELLIEKTISIEIYEGEIIGLKDLAESLELDREGLMVMYYITNFKEKINGEFVMLVGGYDTSYNQATAYPFRVVIENGPSFGLIILILNAAAIAIIGGAIGIYFGISAYKKRKEVIS